MVRAALDCRACSASVTAQDGIALLTTRADVFTRPICTFSCRKHRSCRLARRARMVPRWLEQDKLDAMSYPQRLNYLFKKVYAHRLVEGMYPPEHVWHPVGRERRLVFPTSPQEPR